MILKFNFDILIQVFLNMVNRVLGEIGCSYCIFDSRAFNVQHERGVAPSRYIAGERRQACDGGPGAVGCRKC